jgi:hypothetical protein
MKWFWYISRSDELFLDVDNVEHCIGHIRARLQGAVECGKLHVKSVYRQRSQSGKNEHIIIQLAEPMPEIERFVWETVLHSDIYRACNNIMRSIRGIGAPGVFISRADSFFFRGYDATCNCDAKHTAKIMLNCPVAIKYRGEFRARGFFGKPSRNKCEFI